MKRLAVVFVATGVCAGPVQAEEVFGARRTLDRHEIKAAVAKAPGGREPGIRLCDFSAYSRDTSPTNLRAAPRANAKIVASLPGVRAEADTKIGPEYQVIAGKDGWFLIRGAYWSGYDKDEKALVLGPVWMAVNLSDFTIWGLALRKAPSEDSATIVELRSAEGAAESWGPDSVKVERVFGCSGSFVDVAIALPDGRKMRGWATGLCENQVTTCGGSGTPIEERAGGLYRSEASCREHPSEEDCPKT